MKFCIRVDDIGWLQNKQPDSGLELAQRFHAALAGLPYLAGVIPACLDQAGLEWLKSSPCGGMTVAQHGWDHRYVNGVASEFHGMGLYECRKRISRGVNVFRANGIAPRHMIPPFNAIVPAFPNACYFEGIRYLWAAPSSWPTPPQPFPMGHVTCVPSWLPVYAATRWAMSPTTLPLRETLPAVMDQPGKAVLTLHITWEAARCADFEGVRWLVDTIGDRVIGPEEYLAV